MLDHLHPLHYFIPLRRSPDDARHRRTSLSPVDDDDAIVESE
jgi:hypothetical protein